MELEEEKKSKTKKTTSKKKTPSKSIKGTLHPADHSQEDAMQTPNSQGVNISSVDCFPSPPPGCTVISSNTNVCVPNRPYFPRTAMVQIVLAEPTLEICVMSTVKLECPAIEIKRIRKDAFLTPQQCKLLPTCNKCLYKFFIGGYIRKNIEYATANQCNPQTICGDIRHTTAYVPFNACTEIRFPASGPLPLLKETESTMYEFANLGQGPRLDKTMFQNSVCYPNQPICNLVCVNFNEYDIGNDLRDMGPCCPDQVFQTVDEHIVMDIRVRIMQFQPTPIICGSSGCFPESVSCLNLCENQDLNRDFVEDFEDEMPEYED